VVALSVNEDQLVRRLAHRAAEQGRSDDTEDVIRHRQRLYEEETSPLLSVYEKRGLLRIIDGSGEVGDVTQRLLATLPEGATNPST
jgi:adenylate kinase